MKIQVLTRSCCIISIIGSHSDSTPTIDSAQWSHPGVESARTSKMT